ncbi:class I SAM-dependent methyltransferase [Patescibacteria group bacterium]
MNKHELLESYKSLCAYLKEENKITDFDSYFHNFAAFVSFAIHLKTYDFVAPYCDNKEILDVGCFLGYGEACIASKARKITAIDLDHQAIEYAKKNNKYDNVTFEEVDATKLSSVGKTFDVIFAFQLIEHIPPRKVKHLVHSLKGLLNRGGLLFVVTPNRKFRLLPFQQPFNLEHYQEFSSKSLSNALQSEFDEVTMKGIRLKDWLQEIEEKRIHKSILFAYVFTPAYRLLSKIFPTLTKKIVGRLFHSQKPGDNNTFNELFEKFTMEDLYLEEEASNDATDLFAVCRDT